MKWVKIDDTNKPVFDKQYLLGKAKNNIFTSATVYYGRLHKITGYSDKEEYTYEVDVILDWKGINYNYISDITHFIDIDDLPNVPSK